MVPRVSNWADHFRHVMFLGQDAIDYTGSLACTFGTLVQQSSGMELYFTVLSLSESRHPLRF